MILTILFILLELNNYADAASLQIQQAMDNGHWAEVEYLLNNAQTIEELLLRGEARRALGFWERAQEDHDKAWEQAQQIQDVKLQSWAVRASAETLLIRQRYKEAKTRLQAAPLTNDAEELAKRALLQAHIDMALDDNDAAKIQYSKARGLAIQSGAATVSVQAQLAMAEEIPSLTSLEQVAAEARLATPVYLRTNLLIKVAEHARKAKFINFAQQCLEQIDLTSVDVRQHAKILTLQSGLLGDSGQIHAALKFIDKAIAQAHKIGAEDLLLQQEQQRGNLYRILGDYERALLAWRRAVFYLDNMNLDIPVEYQPGKSSFRNVLSPLYLDLMNLLLRQAAKLSEDAAQPLLLEVRNILERLKAAEMQDYLGDACPIEVKSIADLETISSHTALLYPIIFPERLELLLSIGSRQYQVTVVVTEAAIRSVAEDFAIELRQAPISGVPWGKLKNLSRQLFTWIIAPVNNRLKSAQLDTLVVLPDGPLRLFPFAALMDGETFLVEHYAIVNAQNLTMMEPESISRRDIHALVAGMSKPGPVVEEYSKEFSGVLGDDGGEFLASNVRGIRGITLSIDQKSSRIKKTRNLQASERRALQTQLAEQLALPGVEQEIAAVGKVLGTSPLLNQDFVLKRFSQEMERPWKIVHVASHGYFGGSPETSFFMTYDRLLKMNQLSSLISGKEENHTPPELLTLSACQTAEGNDRAPLGITGAAIKAGARSVIGSLWPVSDEATKVLISEFYQNLINSNVTKAIAFRQAQLTILHQENMHHPFYWSPFILIGNWL